MTEKIAAQLEKGEFAGIFMAAGLKYGNAAALKVAAAPKQRVDGRSCLVDLTKS